MLSYHKAKLMNVTALANIRWHSP